MPYFRAGDLGAPLMQSTRITGALWAVLYALYVLYPCSFWHPFRQFVNCISYASVACIANFISSVASANRGCLSGAGGFTVALLEIET